jgi:hypothetical protein
MNGVDYSTLSVNGGLGRPAQCATKFVLDKRTNKLPEELASCRDGNRSVIVREAIQLYADMEERLDTIEKVQEGMQPEYGSGPYRRRGQECLCAESGTKHLTKLQLQ